MRILAIDDDWSVLIALKDSLSCAGHSVEMLCPISAAAELPEEIGICSDCAILASMALAAMPQIVLLDHDFGSGMSCDGESLARELREKAGFALRIIGISWKHKQGYLAERFEGKAALAKREPEAENELIRLIENS